MRFNATWGSYKKLRKYHFLSMEELYAFCEQVGIPEEDITVYRVL